MKEASSGAGLGFLLTNLFSCDEDSESSVSVWIFQTVETNLAMSLAVAVDVSKKFALETVNSEFDDRGDRLGVLGSVLDPALGPPI